MLVRGLKKLEATACKDPGDFHSNQVMCCQQMEGSGSSSS